jgi:AraC-like DNA-binding protein
MSTSARKRPHRQLWSGELGIDAGFAFFIGQTGDNQSHAHWAHQCTVRLDQAITILNTGLTLQDEAIFVPAGVEHRLIAPRHLSLFFDPTSKLGTALYEHLNKPRSVQILPREIADFFKTAITHTDSVQDLHQHCLNYFMHHQIATKPDPRLQIILQIIHHEISAKNTKISELAQQLALSDSRFSHWFREQTGMPLRGYRKWLRLILALDAILNGSRAIDAAHLAGFSDQAHFSRTFLAMFGVSPHSLLRNLVHKKD